MAGIALFDRAFDVRHPRRFAERAYSDLRQWSDMPRGGHFPALEEPELLVGELRSFFRPLR